MNFIVFAVFECETKTIKPPGGFEPGKDSSAVYLGDMLES